MGKKTGLGMVLGAGTGAVKEVPTEVIEETVGGQLPKNVALRSVDPTQSLMQGMGAAGGDAAAGALVVGGGVGAISGRGTAPTPPSPTATEDQAELDAQTAREQARDQQRAARLADAQEAEGVLAGTDYAAMERRKQQLLQSENAPGAAAEIAQIKAAQRALNMQALSDAKAAREQESRASAAAREQESRASALAQQSAFATPGPQQVEMGGFGAPGTLPLMEEPPAPAPTPKELEAAGQRRLPLREIASGQAVERRAFAEPTGGPTQMFLPEVGYSGTAPTAVEAETPAPTRKELEAAGQLPLPMGRPTRQQTVATAPVAPIEPVEPTPAPYTEAVPEPTLRAKPVGPHPALTAEAVGGRALNWADSAKGRVYVDELGQLTPAQVQEVRESLAAHPDRDKNRRAIFNAIHPAGDAQPEPTPESTPEPTPEPTPESTPESTPEPTPEPVAGASGAQVIDDVENAQTDAEYEAALERLAAAWTDPEKSEDSTVDDYVQNEYDNTKGFKQAFDAAQARVRVARRRANAGDRVFDGDAYRTPTPLAAPATSIPDAELRKLVDTITQSLGLKDGAGITVLDSVRQMDPKQRAGSRSGVLTADGQIYLFRDGIADGLEGQRTIFHELLHKGLRALFPQQVYWAEMNKLYQQSAKVRALADAWLAKPGNRADAEKVSPDPAAQRALAVDEVLAEMAESRKTPKTVRQLGNWLAGLADRMGLSKLARSIRTMNLTPLEAFIDDALRAASGTAAVPGAPVYRTSPAERAARATELMNELAPPQAPDPGVVRSAREALTSAVQNPKEVVVSVKEATATIAERFGNWAWDTSTVMQGALKRAAIEANMTAPQKTALLMRAATNLAVHAENSADQYMVDGAAKYDAATHSFRTVKSKANFNALAAKFDTIAKKYGKTVPEIEQMWHLVAEAARVQELVAANTRLETRAAKLKAEGETKRAEALLEKVRPMQRDADQVAKGQAIAEAVPELLEASKIWDTIRGNTIDVLVEGGMHSQAEAEALFDNMAYVPFYRDEQLEANKGPKEFMSGFMVAGDKRMKGSVRPVADIFDNTIRWTRYAVERSVRNRKSLDMLAALQDAGLAKPAEGLERGKNIVTVFRDGEKEFYDVSTPGIMEAFQGMESVAIPALSMAAKFANMLRQSIVLFPLFPILQVPQDSFAAMFSSGLKPRFALTIPARAVMEFARTLKGTSKTHEQLRRYGATGQKDVSAAIRRNDYEVAAGIKGPPGFIAQVKGQLHHLSMASDNAVRQAVYQAAEAQGMSKSEALMKATDIINFRYRGRSGALAVAAQVIPFFNAYLAASHVVYKTLTGTGLTPTERMEAYKTLAATTTVVIAASFVYAAIASGDDDYEKIPSFKRDRMLLIPGMEGFGIPLRPDVFLLPKILGEHLWNTLSDNGTTDGAKFRTAVKGAIVDTVLSPTAVPQMVKPAVEVMVNYNTMTKRALIGPYEQQRDASTQYNERTSEMAKALSNAMGPDVMSPIAIDHMIRGWFGSFGGTFLYVTNIMMGEAGAVERADLSFQDALATFPGLSSVVTKTNETGLEADFYELRNAVRRAKVTLDDMEKRAPHKIEEYLQREKVAARLELVETVDEAANALSELARDRREVVASTMSAAEKTEVLREMDLYKAQILENSPLRELRERARL